MAGSSASGVLLVGRGVGEGVVRPTRGAVCVAEEAAATSRTFASGTEGWGTSTVGAAAGGGLSVLLLLLLLLDDAGEDEKVENPGMVMADRRLLRTLRLRARPLRGVGVSEFGVDVAAAVLGLLESLDEVVGTWLDEAEKPGMPIAEKRLLLGRRVLRLRVGAGSGFPLAVEV